MQINSKSNSTTTKQNLAKSDTNTTALASWTPIENNYYHFLTFDLGETRTITKVATLGRSHTNEYVTEFVVQYSDDGEMWRSFVMSAGEVQVTHKNESCLGILLAFCLLHS